MLRPDRDLPQVYLYRTPIDMRKQRNGLAALVQEAMHANPFEGGVFVFIGRRYDRIKILHWDVNGFSKPSTQDPWRVLRTEATLLPMASLVRS